MKTINIGILVIGLVIFFLLAGIAEADQVLYIKIKSLDIDKSYNAFRVGVNITLDTKGNLTYKEEYFTVDSYDQPKLYTSARYDTELTDISGNSAYFEILRPRDKSGKVYSSIRATVLLEKNVIFQEWIPLDVHYKMDNLKNFTKNMSIGNRSERGKVVATRPPIRPTNYNGNKTIMDINEKTPGFDVVMAMMMISIAFIYIRRKWE